MFLIVYLDVMLAYLELILYKTYADLKAETERTYLGFLWWIFEPILFMGVFYFVFGVLQKQPVPNFVPFLLVGLITWEWFKACVSHGASVIYGQYHLMQHVHLPKVLFPIILILTDSFKFAFVFSLLLLYLWSTSYPINIAYWSLPVVLFVELLFTMAITFWVAAIVPFVPDLRFVIENFLTAVFMISGVFFSAEQMTEGVQFYFYLNPMANLIEDYRNILLHGKFPNWSGLMIITIVSLIGILTSMRVLRRFEYVYPKITP
jgi:lipopolysaccharide transport system permease protein